MARQADKPADAIGHIWQPCAHAPPHGELGLCGATAKDRPFAAVVASQSNDLHYRRSTG